MSSQSILDAVEERNVRVVLSHRQVCQEAARILRLEHNLPPNSYLENGYITTGGSHRRDLAETHGKPTKAQKIALEACAQLERIV